MSGMGGWNSPRALEQLFLDSRRKIEETEQSERQWLQEQGWTPTVINRGIPWLWQKKIPDGRVVLVETGMALHIQEHWDDLH